MQNYFKDMLDYCDKYCDQENGKFSIVFSNCFLEKVLLRKRSIDQTLVNYLFFIFIKF